MSQQPWASSTPCITQNTRLVSSATADRPWVWKWVPARIRACGFHRTLVVGQLFLRGKGGRPCPRGAVWRSLSHTPVEPSSSLNSLLMNLPHPSTASPRCLLSRVHFLFWSFIYQKCLSLSENKSTWPCREKLFRKHVSRFRFENLYIWGDVGNLTDPPPSLVMVYRTGLHEMSQWMVHWPFQKLVF